MTVYVETELDGSVDDWYYSYDPDLDLLTARRGNAHFPTTTLAGTYDLIMKVDANQIISTVISTMSAAPKFWQGLPNLEVPSTHTGRVYLQDDIDDGQTQAYFTNRNYSVFYTRLGESVDTVKLNHVAIGQQIIIDITQDGMLAGIWMLDLPPEIEKKHTLQQPM